MRGSIFFRRLLAALGFVLWAAPAGAISTTPTWRPPQTILSGNTASYDNQRGDRFLAYDHYGVPNTVSVLSGGSVAFSRQLDGAGWNTGNFGGANARHASLAFDRHELPGVVYGDDAGLHYVYYSASTMSFQNNLIDNTSVSGRQWSLGTGIAFDLYGRPAIAASVNDGNSGDLYFVRDSNLDGALSSADTVELVTNQSDQFPSLVFDKQNRPLIASRSVGTLGFTNLVQVWTKDPFLPWFPVATPLYADPGLPDAVIGSIAIDPTDGLPGLAWTDTFNGTSSLIYAKWNQRQNQWDQTTVASSSTIELGNESLAFDPSDGRPAISYGDKLGNVKFAWFNGSAWTTQNATATGTAFAPRTSLAFNEFGHGFPAIAYITNTGSGTGSLHFVVDPPSAVPEPSTLLLVACAAFVPCVGGRRRGPHSPRAQHRMLTDSNCGRATFPLKHLA